MSSCYNLKTLNARFLDFIEGYLTFQGSVKLSDYEVWNSEKISLNNER